MLPIKIRVGDCWLCGLTGMARTRRCPLAGGKTRSLCNVGFTHSRSRGWQCRRHNLRPFWSNLGGAGKRTGRDEYSHSARYLANYLGEADDRDGPCRCGVVLARDPTDHSRAISFLGCGQWRACYWHHHHTVRFRLDVFRFRARRSSRPSVPCIRWRFSDRRQDCRCERRKWPASRGLYPGVPYPPPAQCDLHDRHQQGGGDDPSREGRRSHRSRRRAVAVRAGVRGSVPAEIRVSNARRHDVSWQWRSARSAIDRAHPRQMAHQSLSLGFCGSRRKGSGFVGVVKSNVHADIDFGTLKAIKPEKCDLLANREASAGRLEAPIVPVGCIGVWKDALQPGKYYFPPEAFLITEIDTRAQVWTYAGGYTRSNIALTVDSKGDIVQMRTEENVPG